MTCKAHGKGSDVHQPLALSDKPEGNTASCIKGDWTDKNPEILEQLQKFGRAGVPLNLLYSPKSPDSPIVLPSILTKSAVIEAVDKLPQ